MTSQTLARNNVQLQEFAGRMSFAAAVDYSWSLSARRVVLIGALGGVYGGACGTCAAPTRTSKRPRRGAGAAFVAGLAVLFIALCSPIDTLGEERLFSVHMIQHLLLADIAPILLLLGLTRAFCARLSAACARSRRRSGRSRTRSRRSSLFVATMWVWHLPALYELALRPSRWAHALEHVMFFSTGIAFWWFLIEPVPPRHRLKGLGSVAYIGSAKLLMGALGVVLAFSPNAIYDTYKDAPRAWGLSAVTDLNVGGVVMMLEQSIVLVIVLRDHVRPDAGELRARPAAAGAVRGGTR